MTGQALVSWQGGSDVLGCDGLTGEAFSHEKSL
jgi:hypothetical protein